MAMHFDRRQFLGLAATAAGAVGIFVGMPVLGRAEAEAPEAAPDLTMEREIHWGEPTPVVASTDYLKVLWVQADSRRRKVVFKAGYAFASRRVKGAELRVRLLDSDGRVVAEHSFSEEVGPEVATSEGVSGEPLILKWDRERVLLAVFEEPAAAKARVLRIDVWSK